MVTGLEIPRTDDSASRPSRLALLVVLLPFLVFPAKSLSQDAYLRVASKPAGARIALDGDVVGHTGSDFESSPVIASSTGTHELYVFLIDVGEDRFDITLFPNDTLEVFVELVSNQQTLNLTTTPSGADVVINGVEMGQTPLEGFTIMGADYQISLTRSCYLPFEMDVAMGSENQKDLHIDLRQTVTVSSPLPPQVADVSLCQDGRRLTGRYMVVPGPTGSADGKWNIRAALLSPAGAFDRAKISGEINRSVTMGEKTFEIELPSDVSLNDRFDLEFSVLPQDAGSNNTLLLVGGAALLIGGGIAAATLLSGGDDGPSTAQPALPPGRPQ